MDKEAMGDILKYLDGRTAEKVGEKMGELGGLLNTRDVQLIKEKLDSSGVDLSAVIKDGNIDALRGIFSDIASTGEGARLLNRLRGVLGGA
ncbi:MAG: hypothetical protein LBS51_05660 [Oscillospiraceae bacterium]|jgi:hypothetical protein|nr:hypothetical protein [Oscillospiraceae bacterium]